MTRQGKFPTGWDEKRVKLEIGKQKFGRDETSVRVGCLQTAGSVNRYGLA